MKKLSAIIVMIAFIAILGGCGEARYEGKIYDNPNETVENLDGNKLIIYQMMTRLFANTNTNNAIYGSIDENGVGKFNNINDAALESLAELGITHVWYTGVIEHMVMNDYTEYGIAYDDPDVIKGRAGSPYAIKDYYDVNPDLAEDVANRMAEFEALIARTHNHDLKVIIDFVPNHVGRTYASDNLPEGEENLGEGDDTSVAFDADNNFYYIVDETFVVPDGYDPAGEDITLAMEDGEFDETPAKMTGNHSGLDASPSEGDWFETIRLNYGIDYTADKDENFDPVPSTWEKMVNILKFWAEKEVDGVRCDMAEMVPEEFWTWAIPQVKEVNPEFIFIAEIYSPGKYDDYLEAGFDYLYDKVGLYDALIPLIKGRSKADSKSIYTAWYKTKSYPQNMLRFLENHDEIRMAAPTVAPTLEDIIPAMTITATLSSGPVMIYFGQELGVAAIGEEGFSGNDNKTTIFDYWGIPELQGWINGYEYDGAGLTDDQIAIRNFYSNVFALCKNNSAIYAGQTYDLYYANQKGASAGYNDEKMYTYLRYSDDQTLLVAAYFGQDDPTNAVVKIPQEAWDMMELDPATDYTLQDIFLTDSSVSFNGTNTIDRTLISGGIPLEFEPNSIYVYELN